MIEESLARRRRVPGLALVLGFVVAAALVTLAFVLGAWAYEFRRYSLHDRRLRRLVEQHPQVEAATAGLLAETGNRAITTPGREELRALVARWAPQRVDEVLSKRDRWADVRLFAVHDMVYVIYLDGQGRVQDYVLLSARR